MSLIKYLLIGLFNVCIVISSSAQLWSDVNTRTNLGEPTIKPAVFRTLGFNSELMELELSEVLSRDNGMIEIPLPDGGQKIFIIQESRLLHPQLQEKYPHLLSFKGVAIDDPSTSIRIEYTHHGFHAMIMGDSQTIFIDPYNSKNTNKVITYTKKSFVDGASEHELAESPMRTCKYRNKDSESDDYHKHNTRELGAKATGAELRTYNLAVTATGEYTSYHGGTVNDAMAAIVSTVNRVTGVYEREVAVSFQLVANNDLLIYTDGDTDPYSNDDSDYYIDECHNNITAIIGVDNFDVGHGFSTGAGGLASLACICSSGSKGMGVTGRSNPVGDPYDIDYVAHELGHQFGGSHIFNGDGGSCANNRSSNHAYEPGSGTTIMAYAGICGDANNTSNNSSDYFHTDNYDQIIYHTTQDAGNSCATITATGNTSPTVSAGTGGYTIPMQTPFVLDGNASDDEGDDITYCWEQYDLGPQGIPNAPSGNAPIFRSFPPTSDTYRIFPQMSDIVDNIETLGEQLPSYIRDLTFRLTARDNNAVAGGVDYDQISFSVTDAAGPFQVTYPNSGISKFVNEIITVTWDVAGTNVAPVNCQNVNILLSLDGGYTYPIVLKSNTANDGAESITIPNNTTSTARIMVEAEDNVFFNISNTDFTIIEAVIPDFTISINPINTFSCIPDDATVEVSLSSLAGFNESVTLSATNLPAGLNAAFSDQGAVPSIISTLTLSGTSGVTPGVYIIDVTAESASETHTDSFEFTVIDGLPSVGALLLPVNGAIDQPSLTEFAWSAFTGAESYIIEIASDDQFSSIVVVQNNIENTNYTLTETIDHTTQYFWRIKGVNSCGESTYSEIFDFSTVAPTCVSVTSSDTPIGLSEVDPDFISSELVVATEGTIIDINVSIQGLHSYISDIDFALYNPGGEYIILLSEYCGGEDDFNFIIDDDGDVASNMPCPPIDGLAYQSVEPLSLFNGQDPNGIWKLEIADYYSGDGGELTSWTLEVCTDVPVKASIVVEELDFSIIPNPNNGVFKVIVSNKMLGSGEAIITVSDIAGKQLLMSSIGKNEKDIDLSLYPSGIYFVSVGTVTKKVIKY